MCNSHRGKERQSAWWLSPSTSLPSFRTLCTEVILKSDVSVSSLIECDSQSIPTGGNLLLTFCFLFCCHSWKICDVPNYLRDLTENSFCLIHWVRIQSCVFILAQPLLIWTGPPTPANWPKYITTTCFLHFSSSCRDLQRFLASSFGCVITLEESFALRTVLIIDE